jgi:hypothetical protein
MKKLKPAGQGHLKQTAGPSVDYRTRIPSIIDRYGPDSYTTNYPASRVATGRVPDTDTGLKRYTASVDGDNIKVPRLGKASKYDHGAGAESQTYTKKWVAQSGPSQHPTQVTVGRSGKRSEK